MDPDPEGPKTCGSGGSGTLPQAYLGFLLLNIFVKKCYRRMYLSVLYV